MAKHLVTKGNTSRTEYVLIQDSSSSVGAGLTGLAFNTASLVAYYVRPLGNATSITLATQTVTGAWSSGGFVEVSSANMPGLYRFDIPDAIFASGVDKAIVMLKGATNMAPVTLEYELTGADLQDATGLGLSRIDAAITTRQATVTFPTNFSSLSINGSGQVDAIKIAGTTQTARDLGASVLLSSGTGAGQISLSSGLVTLASGTHTGAVIPTVTSVTNGVTIAVGGADATSFTSAAKNALADALLDRNMATGTDSGTDSTVTRTVRQALRVLRNKNSIAAGTQTVFKEDDSTTSHTSAVTTTAGNPISAVDPT